LILFCSQYTNRRFLPCPTDQHTPCPVLFHYTNECLGWDTI
jgi:hypothetical protein